jgi:hypothetical protein
LLRNGGRGFHQTLRCQAVKLSPFDLDEVMDFGAALWAYGPHPPDGTFSHLRREKAQTMMCLLLCEAWEKVPGMADEGSTTRVLDSLFLWCIFLVIPSPHGVLLMTVSSDGVEWQACGLRLTWLELPGASGVTLGHYGPSAFDG